MHPTVLAVLMVLRARSPAPRDVLRGLLPRGLRSWPLLLLSSRSAGGAARGVRGGASRPLSFGGAGTCTTTVGTELRGSLELLAL